MQSRQVKWQQKNITSGLCQICGQHAVTKVFCQEHREYARKKSVEWRKKNPTYLKKYLKKWCKEHSDYFKSKIIKKGGKNDTNSTVSHIYR